MKIPAIPTKKSQAKDITSDDFFVGSMNNSLSESLDVKVESESESTVRRAVSGLDGDWDHGIYTADLFQEEEGGWDDFIDYED